MHILVRDREVAAVLVRLVHPGAMALAAGHLHDVAGVEVEGDAREAEVVHQVGAADTAVGKKGVMAARAAKVVRDGWEAKVVQ